MLVLLRRFLDPTEKGRGEIHILKTFRVTVKMPAAMSPRPSRKPLESAVAGRRDKDHMNMNMLAVRLITDYSGLPGTP